MKYTFAEIRQMMEYALENNGTCIMAANIVKLFKESISKEMNNDNDLNLHCMTNSPAGFATGRYVMQQHKRWR